MAVVSRPMSYLASPTAAQTPFPRSQPCTDGRSHTVITDPMDKNFDLEAYLNLVSAEST